MVPKGSPIQSDEHKSEPTGLGQAEPAVVLDQYRTLSVEQKREPTVLGRAQSAKVLVQHRTRSVEH